MNFDELVALKYLQHIGFSNITYEPDGNIPPDYLLDNNIAIEVRRLNQQIQTRSGLIGLEQEAIPFTNRIENLLDSIDVTGSFTWFVSIFFRRPLPMASAIKEAIQSTCMEISQVNGAVVGDRIHKPIFNGVDLYFTRGSLFLGKPFALATVTDLDAGGFVYDQLSKNIDRCIHEKTVKISNHQNRYKNWWLILVDHISYCHSTDEMKAIKATRAQQHPWDKVIIVSAIDHTKSFEF